MGEPNQRQFLVQVLVNVTIFFATIVITYGVLSNVAGWNPEKKLDASKRRLSLLQVFLLVLLVTTISTIMCFRCNPIKEGIFSGVVFVLVLKSFYQWNHYRGTTA